MTTKGTQTDKMPERLKSGKTGILYVWGRRERMESEDSRRGDE